MTYNISCTSDDEALARALQEEYEKEYRRRSMQQHLRQMPSPSANGPTPITNHRPTAPPLDESQYQSQYRAEPSARRHGASAPNEVSKSRQQPSRDRIVNHQSQVKSTTRQLRDQSVSQPYSSGRVTSHNPIESTSSRPRMEDPNQQGSSGRNRRQLTTDEEFARQLDRQLRAQAVAETRSRVPHGETSHPPTSRSASRSAAVRSGGAPVISGRLLTDEELARRLAQEERDAAVARTLAHSEAQSNRPASVPPKTCLGRSRRFLSCLVTIAMVALAVGLLYWYFAGPDNLPDFIPDPEMFRQEDPFSSLNSTDANRWRNRGEGLELTVINALDTAWNDYFYKAVSDWDGGTPDSLNLQTQLSTPESVCKSLDGFIKVCNGNYGATNWRGINKVMLENGYIYASAARMNEYYFSGNDNAQRQYTMCHEMGHGFGLPHSDENFYNR
jgi:hypothetical protein